MLRFDDLTTLDQFKEVEHLEGEIRGPIDLVPVPILAVSVRRGAVLVGAYDGPRLVGFVDPFPALKLDRAHNREAAKPQSHEVDFSDGAAGTQHPALSTPHCCHWSHMLGVHPDYRGTGLGRDLKLAQRERVLALGLDSDRVDLRPAAGAEREPQLRDAWRHRRGVRGERLRRVGQPAARRPADRPVRLPVVDPPAACREADRAGRAGRAGSRRVSRGCRRRRS